MFPRTRTNPDKRKLTISRISAVRSKKTGVLISGQHWRTRKIGSYWYVDIINIYLWKKQTLLYKAFSWKPQIQIIHSSKENFISQSYNGQSGLRTLQSKLPLGFTQSIPNLATVSKHHRAHLDRQLRLWVYFLVQPRTFCNFPTHSATFSLHPGISLRHCSTHTDHLRCWTGMAFLYAPLSN